VFGSSFIIAAVPNVSHCLFESFVPLTLKNINNIFDDKRGVSTKDEDLWGDK
jgi:hypothetical protein